MSQGTFNDKVFAFLSEGTRTAKVAFVGASGRALVAPVWFIVDGGQLVFNTRADTAKGAAILRDPRLTLLVDDERRPFSFVQIQGIASVNENPVELLEVATTIAERYMGPQLAGQYGRRNGVPGELVVRITPTKVVTGFDVAS